jgi:hypothetical protein
MEQEQKTVTNNIFVNGGQVNIASGNGVINATQNNIEEKNQKIQNLKRNKIIYYVSKKVLEQLLGINTKNKSEFALATYFIEHEKEFNIYNDIFKAINEERTGEYFKFKSRCEINETFIDKSDPKIVVEIELNNCIIKGICSLSNWISESYLNNLLFARNVDLVGIGKIIGSEKLNSKTYVQVQFLVIGEEGIFND